MEVCFVTDADYIKRRSQFIVNNVIAFKIGKLIIYLWYLWLCLLMILKLLFYREIDISLGICILIVSPMVIFLINIISTLKRNELPHTILRLQSIFYHCNIDTFTNEIMKIKFNSETYDVNYLNKTRFRKYKNIHKVYITNQVIYYKRFYVDKNAISETEFNELVEFLNQKIPSHKIKHK
jgi:hypothetical protein